jgi:hypothetical protein
MFALVRQIHNEVDAYEGVSNNGASANQDALQRLEITSHRIARYFMRRRIHPHEAYPEFFSTEEPMAALTYEWSTNFKGLHSFLNSENISKHNRFNTDASWGALEFSPTFLFSMFRRLFFSRKDWDIPKYFCDGTLILLSRVFCCNFYCEPVGAMPSNTSKLRLWIDIFFIDQNSPNLKRELDNAEDIYRHSRYHIAIASSGLVKRAWCLLELLVRAEASRSSAMIGAYGVDGQSVPVLDLKSIAGMDFYAGMEASKPEDKDSIQQRILALCGTPDAFNRRFTARAITRARRLRTVVLLVRLSVPVRRERTGACTL